MMNYYGFPPGYAPDPVSTSTPVVAPIHEKQARRVNAQYISPDGEQVCKRLFDKWLIADWDGGDFGAWRETGDYPDGWVKL
jgi:hypothetical protein